MEQFNCEKDVVVSDATKVLREMSTYHAKNMVVGFVGRKVGMKPKKNPPADSWITLKGKGKLFEPTDNLKNICEQIDIVFENFNGSGLLMCSNPLERVINLVKMEYPTFPISVVKLYCKVRFHARLRQLNGNMKLKTLFSNKSLRASKQVSQFVN